MQSFEITTQKGKMHYWEDGEKSNLTIVCLHGLAGNGLYSFGELMPFLKEHFHLIILDSPGHGKTSAFLNEDDYLFSNLSTWLEQAVGEIVDGPLYILGHSWGADVALHFTRFHLDRVLGLMLLDGGFTFPQNQPEMTFDYAYAGWNNYMEQSAFANKEEIFQEYRTYTKRWDSRKELYAASLFQKNQKGEMVLRTSKFTVLAIIHAFFKEPFADAYPFIDVPTLLIYASHPVELDTARAKGILQLQENIEDITIEKIANSSHMLQWDKPEQTAALITKWINAKNSSD